MTSSPGDDAVEAVRQGRADTAVVWSRPLADRDLEGIVLGSVPFGVVLPEGSFARRSKGDPRGGTVQRPRGEVPAVPVSWHLATHRGSSPSEGARPGQVVVEPDLINSPEAMVRAVASGSAVAPGILGVAEHMDVKEIVVRPLDPPLFLDLEVVWRRPARAAVRRLVGFLIDAVNNPDVLLSAHLPE